MCSWSAIKASGVESPLHKRSQRSLNNSKLISRRPIIWHEQREQREQRFKIKGLHHERGAHEVRTT